MHIPCTLDIIVVKRWYNDAGVKVLEIGTIMSRTGGKEVLRMLRKFNITGICIPSKHYMVDMSAAIEEIEKRFIRQGEYFTINRARQYGKSTILELLYRKLKDQYIVIDMSFEAANDCFLHVYDGAGIC